MWDWNSFDTLDAIVLPGILAIVLTVTQVLPVVAAIR